MPVLETERLRLRVARPEDDAAFIFALLNDPAWIANIGDRGIATLDDARAYIVERLVAPMARDGVALLVVEHRQGAGPIGLCGLIRREGLEDVDIGFALLPAYRSQGYAYEAAAAVLAWGRETLGIRRIVAIATPTNRASLRLLERLGLRFERHIAWADGEKLALYATSG